MNTPKTNGTDTAAPRGATNGSDSGTAKFTFTDTASGTHPAVSGTLSIHTTPTSASLSGSFASASFPDTAKAIASGRGDTSLLNDLSSGVIGPASGLGTDAGGQGSPIQQPTGHAYYAPGPHDGHGTNAMTGAPHHQFSA